VREATLADILTSSLLFYVVASLLDFSLLFWKTLNDEFC